MTQYGTWSPYVGSDALLLAVALLIIAGVLAYLGTRLHCSVGVQRPGKTVSILLIVIWVLSFLTLGNAVGIYYRAETQQYGAITLPTNPISPITDLSGIAVFIVIVYLARHHGLKIALGSAIVGTIAAPMMFELPFDLIVMWRTYPPAPATQFTLLYFLPLFLWEIKFRSIDVVAFNELVQVHPVRSSSHVLGVRRLGLLWFFISFRSNPNRS
jgi:hypothetical protein